MKYNPFKTISLISLFWTFYLVYWISHPNLIGEWAANVYYAFLSTLMSMI